MTMPPTYHLEDLGARAHSMAKDCGNERLAMIMQYVALGSMIIMTGIAASKVLREVFGSNDHHRSGGFER
jgi:hypothetical protein